MQGDETMDTGVQTEAGLLQTAVSLFPDPLQTANSEMLFNMVDPLSSINSTMNIHDTFEEGQVNHSLLHLFACNHLQFRSGVPCCKQTTYAKGLVKSGGLLPSQKWLWSIISTQQSCLHLQSSAPGAPNFSRHQHKRSQPGDLLTTANHFFVDDADAKIRPASAAVPAVPVQPSHDAQAAPLKQYASFDLRLMQLIIEWLNRTMWADCGESFGDVAPVSNHACRIVEQQADMATSENRDSSEDSTEKDVAPQQLLAAVLESAKRLEGGAAPDASAFAALAGLHRCSLLRI